MVVVDFVNVFVDTFVMKKSMHEIMPGVLNHQTSHQLRDHHVPVTKRNISLSDKNTCTNQTPLHEGIKTVLTKQCYNHHTHVHARAGYEVINCR